VFVSRSCVAAFGLHERPSSRSNVDPRKRMKQTKDIQQPQNYGNDNDAVQDGLDGCLHRNEPIHQPQQYTHNDQNFQQLNQRHDLYPLVVSRLTLLNRPPSCCSKSRF
jgi:hypothetical protein